MRTYVNFSIILDNYYMKIKLYGNKCLSIKVNIIL